jgi:hypothetical protein
MGPRGGKFPRVLACILPLYLHLRLGDVSVLRSIVIAAIGFICVTVWLVMLEVTEFSAWSVSAGLIGGLFVTGITR